MGIRYIRQTTEGKIHVDIELSPDEHFYLRGEVWIENQEKIDFNYLNIASFDSNNEEPSILPASLDPHLIIAILLAAQKFLGLMDWF